MSNPEVQSPQDGAMSDPPALNGTCMRLVNS